MFRQERDERKTGRRCKRRINDQKFEECFKKETATRFFQKSRTRTFFVDKEEDEEEDSRDFKGLLMSRAEGAFWGRTEHDDEQQQQQRKDKV